MDGADGIISLSNTTSGTVTVTAVKPGNATVVHEYSYFGIDTRTEQFAVSVTETEPTTAIDILEDTATVFYNPSGSNPSNDSLAVILHVTTDPDDADVTWTSNNPKIATVDQNGKVTATGRGEGTVTITATSGDLSDTCEITVKSTKGQTPVYIYLNASNLDDYNFPGIVPNRSGWYTTVYCMLGEAPSASSGAMDDTIASWVSSCVRFSGNTGIPTDFLISIVESYDLKLVDNGADNYVDYQHEAWHLNLYASSASTTYPVTVNYIDEGTGDILETTTGRYTINSEVFASWYKKAISGYTFDYADPESITVSNSDKDVLNLYYKKNRTITVSLTDKTVEYDGESHSLDDPKISGGPAGLTADHLQVVVEGGSGTEPGDYEATLGGSETYTSSGVVYDVVYRGAMLHITPCTGVVVTIAENSGTVTYSGSEQELTGYDVESIEVDGKATGLYGAGDFRFIGEQSDATACGTDAGTYEMGLASEMFENTNPNFEDVEFVIVDGTLVIGKRPATVTGDGWNSEQPYTGREYSTDKFAFENIAEGQTASISYELKGTDPGTYEGAFGKEGESDFRIEDAEGKDVTRNYTLEEVPGSLTIVKGQIAYVTLSTTDVVKEYDGNTYEAGIAIATDENGHEAKVEYSIDGENWIDDPTQITATDVADSVDIRVRASVESVYEGYIYGTQKLVIEPRKVIATGDGWNEEQPYTGEEYAKDTYSFENLAENQTATISYSLKGIQPGSYTGVFGEDFKVVTNGRDVTPNYELTEKVPGSLIIIQA